jgi:ubiquinone/menaquinone biosynthesis C-methylase UbiE
MMLRRYAAKQLVQPRGLTGRYLLGPLWNRRNAPLNDRTLDALQLRNHDRVLDIGFGGGYLLAEMAKIVTLGHLSGIDTSSIMVNRALKKFRAPIRKGILDIRLGSAEAMPFADGTFDKISSVNSIFYWSDLAKGIHEAYRVLQKGGLLVLTFTAKQDLDRQEFGIQSFTEDQVMNIIRGTGFDRIDISRDRDAHRAFSIVVAEK